VGGKARLVVVVDQVVEAAQIHLQLSMLSAEKYQWQAT
jgi:hypothetical protein